MVLVKVVVRRRGNVVAEYPDKEMLESQSAIGRVEST
jgi:hypothetical protein